MLGVLCIVLNAAVNQCNQLAVDNLLLLQTDAYTSIARPTSNCCFLADRTNGLAIATLFCLSVCPSVCDVMYCG